MQKIFDQLASVKQQLYALSESTDVFQICDSNEVHAAMNAGKYEILAGYGLQYFLPESSELALNAMPVPGKWTFGYIEYPETVASHLSKTCFFVPQIVAYILKDENVLHIVNNGVDDACFQEWLSKLEVTPSIPEVLNIPDFSFNAVTEQAAYIRQVNQIKDDILHGRYYEMNYCIEFRAPLASRPFLPYMLRLNERTSAPFAAYARMKHMSILCSSPERFFMKAGRHLLSQPIKGTNRVMSGSENNKQLQALKNSEKERAENVMIVDLVRNDLAHVCEAGTIQVDELFGTYPFKTLNHMISSVSGKVKEQTSFKAIFEALFPMGSMTGAPKLEVMKHINAYEDHQRGIYSGCLGYVSPEGDCDFNVLIRTLVYCHETESISYKVGSAITFDSEAEHEYEECLLKGHRLEDVFRA